MKGIDGNKTDEINNVFEEHKESNPNVIQEDQNQDITLNEREKKQKSLTDENIFSSKDHNFLLFEHQLKNFAKEKKGTHKFFIETPSDRLPVLHSVRVKDSHICKVFKIEDILVRYQKEEITDENNETYQVFVYDIFLEVTEKFFRYFSQITGPNSIERLDWDQMIKDCGSFSEMLKMLFNMNRFFDYVNYHYIFILQKIFDGKVVLPLSYYTNFLHMVREMSILFYCDSNMPVQTFACNFLEQPFTVKINDLKHPLLSKTARLLFIDYDQLLHLVYEQKSKLMNVERLYVELPGLSRSSSDVFNKFLIPHVQQTCPFIKNLILVNHMVDGPTPFTIKLDFEHNDKRKAPKIFSSIDQVQELKVAGRKFTNFVILNTRMPMTLLKELVGIAHKTVTLEFSNCVFDDFLPHSSKESFSFINFKLIKFVNCKIADDQTLDFEFYDYWYEMFNTKEVVII